MRNTGGGGGEIEIISFQLYSISVDFTVLKGTFGGSKVNAVLPTHHGPAFGIPSHYQTKINLKLDILRRYVYNYKYIHKR